MNPDEIRELVSCALREAKLQLQREFTHLIYMHAGNEPIGDELAWAVNALPYKLDRLHKLGEKLMQHDWVHRTCEMRPEETAEEHSRRYNEFVREIQRVIE